MKTSNNIQSNENKNGMSQVIIDLRPQVKQQDGHGREVLADVHFRIDVRAYSANLYTYTQEAREESNKAVTAFDREVVEMLTAEGWTLKTENYGPGECPELVKGTQYLYCHPQDISGQVNPADIETLEAKIKAMTTCKYFTTDNYGDIIVTTSEADEKQLYRDTYADGLAAIWQEVTTTKRSNLYKDKGEAEHCVRRRICIANRRADLNDIGTGSYNMRTPLLQFLMEEYDRLLKAGYIKEAEGANGRTLCRWINKREEKERAKAIREAEKAEKKRKAQEWQEFLDREAEKQNSFAEGMRVTVPACSLTDGEAFVIVTIRRKAADNGGNASLTVKNETTGDVRNINGSDVQDILPPLEPASEITVTEAEGIKIGDTVRHNKHEEVATVTAIREAFVNGCDDYRYLYTLDFSQSVTGPFGVELNGGEFLRESFTPCTPVTISTDGESHEPTLYERHNITAGEREAKTKGSASYIRRQARMAREAFYSHKGARIETSIAYRNGTDDPDGMSYKVCWYDETRTGELHLVECENGISLEQAARHMADFSLLSECGLTLREILHPAA